MTRSLSLFDSSQQLDVSLLRRVIVANAAEACNAAAGRLLGDPVFDAVTEGRAQYHGYSGCGDLVHYCLKRAGLRDPGLLNRNDADADCRYRVGQNISRIVYSVGSAFRYAGFARPLQWQPGDIALIGEDGLEHVFVLAECSSQSVTSYDYGQFRQGKPAGFAVMRRVTPTAGRPQIGGPPGRPLVGYLDVGMLFTQERQLRYLVSAQAPDDFDGGTNAPAPPIPPPRSVREIKLALVQLGFFLGPCDASLTADYRRAIATYQASVELEADGVVGPLTRRALALSLAEPSGLH